MQPANDPTIAKIVCSTGDVTPLQPERDKDRDAERAMRREHARLTSELKETREQMVDYESKLKQDKTMLRKRNDDILKLTKTLRGLERDQMRGPAASPSAHATTTRAAETKQMVGNTCRWGAGAAKRVFEVGEDEKLRDQIEELMANSAHLDEKLREERRLREEIKEDVKAANAVVEDKVTALRDGILVCQKMVLVGAKDLRALAEQSDSDRSMLQYEVTGLCEALDYEKKINSMLEDHLRAAREEAAYEKAMTKAAMEQRLLQERRKYEELQDLYEEQACGRNTEKKQLSVAFQKIQEASQTHQRHAKEALLEAASARDSLEAMRRSHIHLQQETRALQQRLQQGLQREQEGEMVSEQLFRKMGNAVGVNASENGEDQVLKLEIEKLKQLLESKVGEILALRQHKSDLQNELEASTSAAGRERTRLHAALVTVQGSHSSLLDCNRVRAFCLPAQVIIELRYEERTVIGRCA